MPCAASGARRRRGHRLGDALPGRRGADARPGREQSEPLTLAQVGQHQQGLTAWVELAPARSDPLVVTADDSRGVAQSLGGQRQRGR